jgi:hypothetical protein
MYYTSDDYPDESYDQPTLRQRGFLARHRLDHNGQMDFHQASQRIGQYVAARRRTSPSDRQKRFLMQHGKWRDGMTRGEAFDLIGSLKRRQNPPK